MADNRYCSHRDEHCFTNLPLLSVISHWFNENNGTDLDLHPRQVVFFFIYCFIAWKLIKIFFRIMKSMVKPFLIFVGVLIVLYTKQFSYSESPADFVINVATNTITIITKAFEVVARMIGAEQVVV